MNDLQYAGRQLARRPGFATLAIGTVALAVGATTAIFSVVDAVLFRALPYPESSRLVTILNTYPHWREREILSQFWDDIQLSYQEYQTLRAANTTYQEVAIHQSGTGTYVGTERPEVIEVGLASETLPAVLGVSPVLGRWFDASEDQPGGEPVAVVRHEFWRRFLGSDSAAVGRTLRIDGEVLTLIGVLPPDFRFTGPNNPLVPDVWLPIGRVADQFDEGSHSVNAIARLGPGVSLAQAQAETEAILRGARSPEVRGARVVSRKEQEVAGTRPVLLMIFGAVGLILLLASTNVGNLLLGRAMERDQEITVRLAMGATRGRLARLVLLESLAVAVLGGILGSLLAWWGIGGLLRLIPASVPRLAEVAVDLRVFGFALLVSLLAGATFALAPMYAATRRDVHAGLKDASTRFTARGRLQASLLVAQLALAVVLLAGALLLTRSLVALGNVDLGFERERLLAFRIDLPPDRYRDAVATTSFFDRLHTRLGALPGVAHVAASSVLPLSGAGASNSVWLESYGPEDFSQPKPEAERRVVDPGYFTLLGVELVRGRRFTDADRADAPPVMVVSRRAADGLWQGRDPLSDRVEMNDQWWTVVGVVADIRDQSPASEPRRTVYVPFAQWPDAASRTIALRTTVPPETVADEIQRVARALDPLLPIRDLQTMDQVLHDATAEPRFRAMLVSLFGMLAALLAAVGIFGVTAHAVVRRTREVGVRMALGATQRDVLRIILSRVAALAGVGLAVGLLGAAGASRVLRGFLFGVSATDPVNYLVIGVGVLMLALAAAYIPAARAARSDPMMALRYE